MSAPNKSVRPGAGDAAARPTRSTRARRRGARRHRRGRATSTRSSRPGSTHAGDRSPAGAGQPRDRRAAARGARPTPASGSARPARPVARRARRAAGRARGRARRARPRRGGRRRHAAVRTAGPRGARHPLTTLQERIARRLRRDGLRGRRGPRGRGRVVQLRRAEHPARPPGARRMQDTFCVEPPDSGVVLRTHTSPVQIRDDARPRRRRSTSSARASVFRTDELDATHTPVFHQVEGLVVDEGITMAHLQGHARPLRRGDVRRRHRDPAAPVTTSRSPSRAPRSTCSASSAAASRSATPTGPAAPAAARAGSSGAAAAWSTRACCVACGIDPERYTGFAFGMGIERTLMFRNDVADMRDMVEGDVRFTAAFGMEV